MEQLKDRLIKFIEYKNMSKRQFLLSCGFSEGYLSSMSKGISYDAIDKIKEKYPELSMPWLVLGEGNMLRESDVIRLHNPPYHEALNENVVVPLYNVEAAANLKMIMENENENVIGYFSLPNMPSVDGAITVRGDSMYPIIKSGDIVIFKWVSSPEYITFGEMYLVSYMWDDDKHVVVKYVKRSQMKDYVTLVSYNSNHEPIDIPMNCIQSIALVKVSIRYNTIS